MSHMAYYDMVVIGAGPAGCTAALYGAQGGLSVLLLEKEIAGGQMTKSMDIDNWIGEAAPVDGMALGERMVKHAVRCGVVQRYGVVLSVKPQEDGNGSMYHITLSDEETPVCCRYVILAAGAVPRKLGLPGEEALVGRGLSFCAACDGRLYRGKSVAVVGGGYTAFHDVQYLSRICSHVTLIHRRTGFSVSPHTVDKVRTLDNVSMLTPYRVTMYRQNENVITGLRLIQAEDNTAIEAAFDGVFLAVGTIPCVPVLADMLPLDKQGAVVVDNRCRTGLPGVFAIGDCRVGAERQILTACADGVVAVRTILGEK